MSTVKPFKKPQPTMKTMQKKASEKLPPFHEEAERALLGAILLDNEAIYKTLEIFSPEDFYRTSHRKIFAAMLALSDRGETIDLLLLREELERMEELQNVGGPAYLAALVDQVPTAANIEYHTKLVHEKAIARNLMNLSIEMACRCYDDKEPADDLLNEAEQKLFAISTQRSKKSVLSLHEIIDKNLAHLERLYEGEHEAFGLSTGFADFDHLTAGLHPGNLIVLAARPAVGKTAFALNIIENIGMRRKKPIAMFSLEMTDEELGMRLICSVAKLNSHAVKRWTFGHDKQGEEAYQKLLYASELLKKSPVYIDDTANIPLPELRAKARRLCAEKQIELLIVDHLTIMGPGKANDSRYREVTEMVAGMKSLAKDLKIPVLLLCQLNREIEKRANKDYQLSDLRDSGAIEEYADLVMFLHRAEVFEGTTPDNEGQAELKIKKHRDGPIGNIPLAFIKEYTRFESLDLQHIPVEPERTF